MIFKISIIENYNSKNRINNKFKLKYIYNEF